MYARAEVEFVDFDRVWERFALSRKDVVGCEEVRVVRVRVERRTRLAAMVKCEGQLCRRNGTRVKCGQPASQIIFRRSLQFDMILERHRRHGHMCLGIGKF